MKGKSMWVAVLVVSLFANVLLAALLYQKPRGVDQNAEVAYSSSMVQINNGVNLLEQAMQAEEGAKAPVLFQAHQQLTSARLFVKDYASFLTERGATVSNLATVLEDDWLDLMIETGNAIDKKEVSEVKLQQILNDLKRIMESLPAQIQDVEDEDLKTGFEKLKQ